MGNMKDCVINFICFKNVGLKNESGKNEQDLADYFHSDIIQVKEVKSSCSNCYINLAFTVG